jgi:hypothetical protein
LTAARTRAQDLPDVPPLADVLPGYEASSWSGFVVPKDTPVEIIDKLNRELNAAAAEPAIQARFADLGGPAATGSPADFGRIIADDVAKWEKLQGRRPDRRLTRRSSSSRNTADGACPERPRAICYCRMATMEEWDSMPNVS